MKIEESVSGDIVSVEKPKNDFTIHGEEAKPEVPTANDAKAEAADTQTDGPVEEEENGDQPSEPEKKPKRGGFQKKISKLEAELAAKDEFIRQLTVKSGEQSKSDPVKSFDSGAPKEEDYQNWKEYESATIDYNVDKKLAVRDLQRQRQEQINAYNNKRDEFKKEAPDFEEVLAEYDAEYPATPAMQSALIDSDMGPQVAYYIAKNPEIGEKMAKMGIIALNKEVARIETKLEYDKSNPKAVVKTTKAPPPISPVGKGKANVAIDADDVSFEDYKAARRSGRI